MSLKKWKLLLLQNDERKIYELCMHSWMWVSVCVYAVACEKQQRVIYVNECHRPRKEEEAEFPGLMSGLMIHQPRLRQASIMDDRVGHAGLLAPWLKRSTAKRLTSSLFLPSFHGDKYRRCAAHARRCTPARLHIWSHTRLFLNLCLCSLMSSHLSHA